MSRERKRYHLAWLLMLTACLTAGCDQGFIQEEARRSVAAFLTGVATTAVNESIGP